MMRFRIFAAATALLITLTMLLVGCSSSPNGNGNGDSAYKVFITLEKNLQQNRDNLWVTFTDGDGNPTGGRVIVDSDPIDNFSGAGKASRTYSPQRWDTGELLLILVIDSTGSVVHRDSIAIPGEFAISNIQPAIGIWRPSDNTVSIEWEASANVSGHTISIQSVNDPAAIGYADYHGSLSVLAATFTRDVFTDQFDELVEDEFDIQVIAWNRNFFPGDDPSYLLPEFTNEPQPIVTDDVSGVISALTVSAAERISVETIVQ